MFCKYCGKALDDKLLEEKGIIFCSNCGKENRKQKSKKQLIDERCEAIPKQKRLSPFGILGE